MQHTKGFVEVEAFETSSHTFSIALQCSGMGFEGAKDVEMST
jgi:hypothetical protein